MIKFAELFCAYVFAASIIVINKSLNLFFISVMDQNILAMRFDHWLGAKKKQEQIASLEHAVLAEIFNFKGSQCIFSTA